MGEGEGDIGGQGGISFISDSAGFTAYRWCGIQKDILLCWL